MKLLDVTEVQLEWLDLSKLTQHPQKPYQILPGHIGTTQILRYIATTLGTLKLHAEDVEDAPWRVLMGMGWETMAAQLYPEMMWPAKVKGRDGIMGHPDGYSWIQLPGQKDGEDTFCVEEFKYTAKSLREKGAPKERLKDIRSEWMWQHQIMSYLALAKHRYLTSDRLIGRFHVLWAMGTYEKYTLDERYLRYTLEYEHEEVARTWEMLQKNRDAAMKWLGATG